MPDHPTRLAEAAQAAWRDAAPGLGLDPQRATTQILSARRETGGGRIVTRITPEDAPDSLILKLRLGAKPDTLEQAVRAYTGAATSLAGQAGLAVPRLIMSLPSHHALILSHSPGLDARSLLADSTDPADHVPVLRAAGQWLGALHRGQPAPPAPFDPAPALRRLARKARAPRASAPLILTPEALQTLAVPLHDRPLHSAVIHGDMTLGNLLIAPDRITGIDLENDRPAPVARDLSMLLVDHEIWFGPRPAAIAAFWQAYGEDLQDDPALRFFIALRLARLWREMPADPRRSTPRRAHVWAGLQAMTARLAADGAG
jgi:aminoglycoside phosphotransferase